MVEKARKGKKEHKAKEIRPELSRKVGMIGVKLNLSAKQFPWEIVSLKEEKLPSMLKKGVMTLAKMRQYHMANFTRIYPKGTRTSSSNYDPMYSWATGS